MVIRQLLTGAGGLLLAAGLHAQTLALSPKAQLDVDYAAHREDRSELDDAGLVRRASLGLEGQYGDWGFEAGYDFSGDGAFKDAYVAYTGWQAGDLAVGQFKVPFGLEQQTSSSSLTFIERSLPSDAFAPSRRRGIGFARGGAPYTIAAMAFGSSIRGEEEGKGVAARATFAPLLEKDRRVLHLGASASWEESDHPAKLSARPEARPADEKLVKTGKIKHVDRTALLGLEAAWQQGPVSVQAEWVRAHLRRTSGRPDLNFDGWYVAGSWLLTGEVRRYRDGKFKSINSGQPGGAWELAARYSRVKLDHRDIDGGREDNITLGVNWYANDHLRLMLNYIDVRSQRRGLSDDPKILLMRAQMTF